MGRTPFQLWLRSSPLPLEGTTIATIMPPKTRPKGPPLWAVDAVKHISRKLTRFQRKLAPAPAALVELVASRWRAHAIRVVAEFGIADVLANGPRDIQDIATAVGADVEALHRVMRALAHDGLLTRQGTRFGLTPMTDALRTDHPRSVRAVVRMLMADYNQETWIRLLDAVKTGEPQFAAHHGGRSVWEWFAEEAPDIGQLFHDAMLDLTRLARPLLLAAHDFGQYRRILDIGGGQGTLISGILSANPTVHGGVLDLPAALEKTPHVLREAGVETRCELIEGNAFESVPGGWDAYVLKHILHGLSDAPLATVLKHLRAGMDQAAKLLVIEALVPGGDKGVYPANLDMQMLVSSGGRERSEAQYRELFDAHGFALREVARTAGPYAVMVVEPCG